VNHGYHTRSIPKGEYGELSKIKEEMLEAEDAWDQCNKVMTLVELSDMIGATKAFLAKYYGKHVTVRDLERMADATERAFLSGERKCDR
jgi:hypothetical protein